MRVELVDLNRDERVQVEAADAYLMDRSAVAKTAREAEVMIGTRNKPFGKKTRDRKSLFRQLSCYAEICCEQSYRPDFPFHAHFHFLFFPCPKRANDCHDARGMAQSEAPRYSSSLSMALLAIECGSR